MRGMFGKSGCGFSRIKRRMIRLKPKPLFESSGYFWISFVPVGKAVLKVMSLERSWAISVDAYYQGLVIFHRKNSREFAPIGTAKVWVSPLPLSVMGFHVVRSLDHSAP